jgi:hypothetical protein
MRRMLVLAQLMPLVTLVIGFARLSAIGEMAAAASKPYRFVGGTVTERDAFAEAYEGYIEIDFELPSPLQIEFTAQLEECDGHDGIYTYQDHTILFCRVSDQDWVALPRLMMHELGHAWDDLNMTDARRSTYMSQSDLEASRTWLDRDLSHDERPGERLANTVAGLVQGLIDRERFDTLTGAG